jgi:O-antigen ligase
MATEVSVREPIVLGVLRLGLAQKVALVILAVVAVWLLSPLPPISTVLLCIAALFLVGLRRPTWAMAAFLVSQLTATSYMVENPLGPAISLRLLLLVLIGVLLWRSKEDIELGPSARRILIPALLLLAVSALANTVNVGLDAAFKDLRNIGAGILIVVLIAGVVRSPKDLKFLLGILFIGAAASAVIGIAQHFQVLGFAQDTLIPGFMEQWGEDIRVPGMAETELELAYVLAAAIPILLAMYLLKGTSRSTYWLLALAALAMGAALYFTYTRSAILAVLLGVIGVGLLLKTRIRAEYVVCGFLLLTLFISVFGVLDSQYLGGRSQSSQEESSISRMVLWQAGLGIATSNPILGIGAGRFTEYAPDYQASVDPGLLSWEAEQYWGYSTLGSEAVHNDFLNVWVSYGTLALIAYIWLLIALSRALAMSFLVTDSRFLKAVAIGLTAALVAYGVNAFYHNLFATMPLLWILGGFTLAIAKLTLSQKVNGDAPLTAQSEVTGRE